MPFAAITTFHDPSVQFGLKFDLSQDTAPEPSGKEAPPPAAVSAKRTLAAVTTATPAGKDKPVAVPALAKPAEPAATDAKPAEPAKTSKAAAKRSGTTEGDEGHKVVSIDAFRKKP